MKNCIISSNFIKIFSTLKKLCIREWKGKINDLATPNTNTHILHSHIYKNSHFPSYTFFFTIIFILLVYLNQKFCTHYFILLLRFNVEIFNFIHSVYFERIQWNKQNIFKRVLSINKINLYVYVPIDKKLSTCECGYAVKINYCEWIFIHRNKKKLW